MTEWMSVKEKLPTDHFPVLVFVTNKNTKNKREELIKQILLARYCYCSGWKAVWDEVSPSYLFYDKNGKEIDHKCRQSFSGLHEVTHWMPLPLPPEN